MSDRLYSGAESAFGITFLIRSLRAVNGGAEMQVTVVIGNGENSETKTLLITTEQYCELDLRKGLIGEEKYEALEKASRLCTALRCGENILSYGSNSVQALTGKLARRGFSREEASEAAKQLQQRGFINENDDVRRETEKCLKKLWGAGRIRTHLWSKGFEKDALACLPELLAEVDFAGNCAELIRKHYGGLPTDPAELRRMSASLYRYGYSFGEIKEAMRLLKRDQQ